MRCLSQRVSQFLIFDNFQLSTFMPEVSWQSTFLRQPSAKNIVIILFETRETKSEKTECFITGQRNCWSQGRGKMLKGDRDILEETSCQQSSGQFSSSSVGINGKHHNEKRDHVKAMYL